MTTAYIARILIAVYVLNGLGVEARNLTHMEQSKQEILSVNPELLVDPETEKSFVIVIPSYNNITWYERNLSSALIQNYTNFRIIYIDDASDDGTGPAVCAYLNTYDIAHRVTYIRNAVRKGALENFYNMIHTCKPHEIIVSLDGDDWLAHDRVLTFLNRVYANNNVWLTYGQQNNYPSEIKRGSTLVPRHITNTNAYRKYDFVTSHVRTFYAGLFQLIARNDLLNRAGVFFPAAPDLALMFPMLEMAGEHIRFIPTPLYTYNNINSLSEFRKTPELQLKCDREIRALKPYARIAKATWLVT